MYRNMIDSLAAWQEDKNRKFLVMKGAKGVGKTWCVVDFAKAFYKHMVHIEFDKDGVLRELFLTPNTPEFIDEQLSILTGQSLADFQPEDVLLIFDEVQVDEDLFAGIMQYIRNRRQYPAILIASWVGMLPAEQLLAEEIQVLTMYPMNFEEFLIASKAQDLKKYIASEKLEGLSEDIRMIVMDYLRAFYITGGMPEVVLSYIHKRDFSKVDMLQRQILQSMRDIILRDTPKNLTKKIMQVWDSIPNQLTKDNKKFMYGVVDSKARAREYVGAVEWLCDAGFVRRLYKIKDGASPITEYVDEKSFELYHLDHGLLRNFSGQTAMDAERDEALFDSMGGILSEQMVLSELTLNSNVGDLYFWTSDATARIDFVFEDDGEIIPVDVQATIRTKAQNLKVFHQKYRNRMAIRVSLNGLDYNNNLLNVPIYGLWNF